MKLEILGPGCPKCKKMWEVSAAAIRESGVDVEMVKVEKIEDIMRYGVMTTPALAVNGQVRVSGRVPTPAEIKKWISE